ncbi:MAG: antibiotic biosynthesis monooxygenase [Alphaproteobacteria bacterium]|nr:antibiotic biosynthesis monooxygenase [Alphaproteobacteria bacterium]
MTSEVSWLLEMAIKDGQLENLKDLIPEMSGRAEAREPGTLAYEWTISEDGSTGHLYERYADSDAALTHIASFNEHFAERFMATVDSLRVWVYGNPSAALEREMAVMDPLYMRDAGGFTRADR